MHTKKETITSTTIWRYSVRGILKSISSTNSAKFKSDIVMLVSVGCCAKTCPWTTRPPGVFFRTFHTFWKNPSGTRPKHPSIRLRSYGDILNKETNYWNVLLSMGKKWKKSNYCEWKCLSSGAPFLSIKTRKSRRRISLGLRFSRGSGLISSSRSALMLRNSRIACNTHLQ